MRRLLFVIMILNLGSDPVFAQSMGVAKASGESLRNGDLLEILFSKNISHKGFLYFVGGGLFQYGSNAHNLDHTDLDFCGFSAFKLVPKGGVQDDLFELRRPETVIVRGIYHREGRALIGFYRIFDRRAADLLIECKFNVRPHAALGTASILQRIFGQYALLKVVRCSDPDVRAADKRCSIK